MVTSSLVESEFDHAHYVLPSSCTLAQVASIFGVDRLGVNRCDIQCSTIRTNVDMDARVGTMSLQGESNLILFHVKEDASDRAFFEYELVQSIESLSRLVGKLRFVPPAHATGSMGDMVMAASERYNLAAKKLSK